MVDVGAWFDAPVHSSPPASACGLFVIGTTKPLPLRTRSIQASVYAEHGFCEVHEELAYVADEDCCVRFVFPLPPRSALYKFTATIGDRKVVTEVKRKAEAKAEYEDAVRQGHTAVHLQQQGGDSLFCVELGNLVAMEEALLSFSYVRLMNCVAGAVEFEHQATWVPPYVRAHEPAAGGEPGGQQAAADAGPVFADKVSYKISYCIKLLSSRGFSSIQPSCPAAHVTEDSASQRTVVLSESVSDPSRDFAVIIELPPLTEDMANRGRLLLQECERQGKRKTVGLATFIPRLPAPAADAPACTKELIFVVDGSGSMGGAPIQQALEAALFFVKDLPAHAGITFNAAVFGSSHKTMWPSSKQCGEASQQEAIRWLQANVNADWGGTEILSVLRSIYEGMPLAPGAQRQIIFLTDGGVSSGEEERIYALLEGKAGSAVARAAAGRTTLFSLGIGHGVHRGLVEGMAKKTSGLAQFVVDGEAIGRKAGVLKQCALAAPGTVLAKPRLVSRSCLVKPAPNVLPPRLFPGEPLYVLLEFTKTDPGACLELTAVREGAAGSSTYCHGLPLDTATRVPGDVLAVLHAMSSISCLMAGTSSLHCSSDGTPHSRQPGQGQVDDAVVALAVQEGLVTELTSAVGVLLQPDPIDPETTRQVDVPLQLPAGRTLWQQQQQQPLRQQQQQQQQQLGTGMRGGGAGGRGMRHPAPCNSVQYATAVPCCAAAPAGFSTQLLARDKQPQLLMMESASTMAALAQVPRKASASSWGTSFDVCKETASRAKAAGPAAPGLVTSMCSAIKKVFDSAKKKSSGHTSMDGGHSEAERRCVSIAAEVADDEEEEAAQDSDMSMGKPEREDNCMEEAVVRRTRQHSSDGRQQQGMVLPPDQVLSLLNLRRTAQGSIPSSPEVLQALAGIAWDQQQQQQQQAGSLAALVESLNRCHARPAGLLDDDAWVTLLAVVYLRKHLAAEHGVWAGLEARAVEWLKSVWPADAGRSMGAAMLAAMKLI